MISLSSSLLGSISVTSSSSEISKVSSIKSISGCSLIIAFVFFVPFLTTKTSSSWKLISIKSGISVRDVLLPSIWGSVGEGILDWGSAEPVNSFQILYLSIWASLVRGSHSFSPLHIYMYR